MKNQHLLIIAATVLSFSANALDKNGKYAIKGVGNASCAQFVSLTKNDDPQKLLFAGWLNGYMTAHNQHLKDNFDVASWENIETLGNYLLKHCEKNPTLSFFQASTQMLSEMYPNRIEEFVGAENAASGKQTQKVYVQVIQRVQQRLTELSLYSGATDGKMTADLKLAIEKFRKANELPPHEFLDQQFLHLLLMSKPNSK